MFPLVKFHVVAPLRWICKINGLRTLNDCEDLSQVDVFHPLAAKGVEGQKWCWSGFRSWQHSLVHWDEFSFDDLDHNKFKIATAGEPVITDVKYKDARALRIKVNTLFLNLLDSFESKRLLDYQ